MRNARIIALLLACCAIAEAQWQKPRREPSPFDPPPLPPLSAASFPGLEVRDAATSVYLALQFGTGKADAVYLYLDAAKPGAVRDALQFFTPDAAGALARQAPLRGSGATYPQRGGGTIRGREFKLPLLETRLGDALIRCAVVLASGYRQPDQLHVDATVQMETPAGKAEYRLGGVPNSFMSPAPEGIKPLPIFGAPVLRAGPGEFDSSKLNLSLRLGEFPILPGKGMGREVLVWLADAAQPLPQRPMRVRWEDRPVLGLRPHETLASVPARLREGANYHYRAELDMGPLFGVLTNGGTFRVESKQRPHPAAGAQPSAPAAK